MDRVRSSVASLSSGLLARLSTGWRWEALLSCLVLFVLAYTWMFSAISVPNERSRLYLTIALVEDGKIQIDDQMQQFGVVYDQAARAGHSYTDKAPGASIVGAMPYWVGRQLHPDVWPIEQRINFIRTWLMLPIGLMGFLILRRLLAHRCHSQPVVDTISLGWILGSAAFHYSTAFYGHQIVAVTLAASLLVIMKAEHRLTSEPRVGRLLLAPALLGAGALAGIAGLTEYQAAIPCTALFGYLIAGPLRSRPLLIGAFVLGATPFAIALLMYNNAAFGGPFELSYEYLVDPRLREVHGKGIGGVSAPESEFALGALFSLHRGIIATSPMFLLTVPGMLILWRQSRRLAITTAFVVAYFMLFISSTEAWMAGWGFGPRLLIPMLTWAALPVACAAESLRQHPVGDGFVRGLVVFGILYFQVVHVVFPELPDNVKNPLIDAVVPALREGLYSPNLGTEYLGLSARSSVRLLQVAIALVACVVSLRGLSSWREQGARLVVVACSFSVMVPLLVLIIYGERGWNDHDRAWFNGWMKTLAAQEAQLRIGNR